jgi:hypothetical protein
LVINRNAEREASFTAQESAAALVAYFRPERTKIIERCEAVHQRSVALRTNQTSANFSSAQPDGDFRMKILTISALAAIALLVGTASILRSHLYPVGTAGMPTMQELHSSANVDKLPSEDFEDRSLVFPRATKH